MWARLVAMFAFWCCALIFGIRYGEVTAWFLVCSLGVILAYLLLVYFSSLRSVSFKLKTEQNEYMSEEDVTITFTIKHNSWFPLFWLVIEQNWVNVTRSKNWTFRQIFFPGFSRSMTGKYKIKSVQRGKYFSKSVEMFTGDIFGFITKRKTLKFAVNFVVYPQPLTILPQFNHLLYGSRDAKDFSGIRDYAMGDPLNRIHWKSTARTNSLKTKELDSSVEKRIVVLLDAGKASYLSDLPVSLFEKSVQVTASVFKYAKENNMASGLICTNTKGSRLPISAYSSLQSAYTLLSSVRSDGDFMFHEVLRVEGNRLISDTMLICVTANVDDCLLDTIRELRSKNIQVCVLFVYSTVSLSWHQLYLKQQLQSMNCLFYSIQHTQLDKQHSGGIEHVG
jgi:uncharacterized protein (DUF58 family)